MGSISYVNGLILAALSVLMAADGVAFPSTRGPFIEAAGLTFTLGLLLCLAAPESRGMNRLHAFLLTSSVWLTAAFAGAVPLFLWSMSPTDAFFEAMSGITTTGSTVMTGLDTTPHGILMWRAILQGVGGVGFIVTGIALLPFLRVGGMQLFRTESSELGDRELTSAARFASATLWIYLGLILACALVYRIGGMTMFEAAVHALTTLSTGGYSTSDASFGHFASPFLQWAGTAFMLAGALPFAWYIRLLSRRVIRSEQVVALLRGLVVVILALAIWRAASAGEPFGQALREVAFNVVSVVTTTGFATADYTTWGPPAVAAFFFLTFVGGCTGSTAGGVKTMRWIVLGRAIAARIRLLHTPHGLFPLQYEGRRLQADQLNGVIAYFSIFFLCLIVLTLVLALLGLDLLTSLSGALTSLTNVGPGVGEIIGPAGNFAALSDPVKWVLCFGMYLGRLEMMTVLVVLVPNFWRELA